MAWKRLRPSALRTVCKSMYIGALISLLTATILGSVYMLIIYLCFKTINNCEFYSEKSIPIKVQWMRSLSDVISCAFLYTWFPACTLFLFRPYQLMGVKRKLVLVVCLAYCLDTCYHVALQTLGISHSKLSTLLKIPLNALYLLSIIWQAYLLKARLHRRFLSRNSMQFLSRRSCTKLQGPFTQAIFVARLDAIFVVAKLHQVSNMFET